MIIVCGIDFSESAAQAAQIAAAIAQRSGAALRLVHVIAPPGPLTPAETHEGIQQATRDWVGFRASELRDRFEIDVEAISELGSSAAPSLVSIACHLAADLIVVASHEAGKQRAWLTGSVAERVAQTSPIPVLVVRDAARLQEWTRGERPLRIMVGVDLGQTARAALKWAAALRAIAPCDLLVTQIAWPFGEHVRVGLPSPIPLDRMVPQLEEILLRDLHTWAGELSGPGQTTFTVSPAWGRVDVHLATLANQVDPDLMVVGTHQKAALARLWQSSVSRGVLHQVNGNVAVVPLGGTTADEERFPSFRRVLVPTDFSLFANRAIPVAYGLVAAGGFVHLLHVVTREIPDIDLDPRERLGALVPRGAAARGIATELEVVRNEDAATAIWHAAGRLGVDAICMATHGRSGLGQLAMGSQAQEVLRRSRQPVLLVPPDREQEV